ncbi:cyclopropane fatty acyl phospholipid synthase [Gallaecimonas mangrovi]|uniref:cyclopropane fatty acyl phospholipid synthase n=1 Tax=Gallaecimonas mangrovi TaxID=2291597 RepID=UPI000E20693F|nr:cyclopropane fatty acyl phospholipid synthase [Gallaecimonas mangrovi]
MKPLKGGSSLKLAEELLSKADIKINGDRPWDMQIHNSRVVDDALARGNLGLGECYMQGDWDAESLDQFFYKLLRADIPSYLNPWKLIGQVMRAKMFNLQNRRRAWQVGEQHYDIGNQFYEGMLDHRLVYSCGYWNNANTLEEAQEAKLDLVCRKLGLKPGMKVLDIGCGWGSFLGYAAEHYGVKGVGVTISKEQQQYALKRYSHLDLEIRLEDYRNLNEPFDRISSIGMFEHVGHKNHRTFMEVASRCLAPDGLMLLHTIGKNYRKSTPDPWVDKYIFPNGDLPSIGQVADAAEGNLIVEDLHNFGSDYDKTLMAWYDNFEKIWPDFADNYPPRFYRMWRYYLLSCAGAFRARDVQLWQFLMSPQGVIGGAPRVV